MTWLTIRAKYKPYSQGDIHVIARVQPESHLSLGHQVTERIRIILCPRGMNKKGDSKAVILVVTTGSVESIKSKNRILNIRGIGLRTKKHLTNAIILHMKRL